MGRLWWIMDKFNVLPTDQRFLDLTPHQINLLYLKHLESTGKLAELEKQAQEEQDRKADDEEYEEYANGGDGEGGRLPLQDKESYNDPEFDDYWNEESEEPDTDDTNIEDDSDFEEV